MGASRLPTHKPANTHMARPPNGRGADSLFWYITTGPLHSLNRIRELAALGYVGQIDYKQEGVRKPMSTNDARNMNQENYTGFENDITIVS